MGRAKPVCRTTVALGGERRTSTLAQEFAYGIIFLVINGHFSIIVRGADSVAIET